MITRCRCGACGEIGTWRYLPKSNWSIFAATIPYEDYNQMIDMLNYEVKKRTGLPLYDLRVSKGDV